MAKKKQPDIGTAPGPANTDPHGQAVSQNGGGGKGGSSGGIKDSDGTTFDTKKQMNAYDAMVALLTSYGIKDIAKDVADFVKQGYTGDALTNRLRGTDAYKQRFVGIDLLRQKAAAGETGVYIPDEATYVSQEKQYTEALSRWGLPKGFYDDYSDFGNWIAQGVSVDEIDQRAQWAHDAVNAANPNYVQALKDQGLTNGDLAAFFLDPKKAESVLSHAVNAAQIGKAAYDQHLQISGDYAGSLADRGVTAAQAQQGFQTVESVLPTLEKLGNISGQGFNQKDAVEGFVAGDQTEMDKANRLASQERARFSGSSAVGSSSLSNAKPGSY